MKGIPYPKKKFLASFMPLGALVRNLGLID